MGEPTDPAPPAGSGPRAIAAAVRLSPLQEAWGCYTRHTLACAVCRDVDRGRCATADELYRAYQAQQGDIFRQLGEGAGSRPPGE